MTICKKKTKFKKNRLLLFSIIYIYINVCTTVTVKRDVQQATNTIQEYSYINEYDIILYTAEGHSTATFEKHKNPIVWSVRKKWSLYVGTRNNVQ